jgi:hypothetical protein
MQSDSEAFSFFLQVIDLAGFLPYKSITKKYDDIRVINILTTDDYNRSNYYDRHYWYDIQHPALFNP